MRAWGEERRGESRWESDGKVIRLIFWFFVRKDCKKHTEMISNRVSSWIHLPKTEQHTQTCLKHTDTPAFHRLRVTKVWRGAACGDKLITNRQRSDFNMLKDDKVINHVREAGGVGHLCALLCQVSQEEAGPVCLTVQWQSGEMCDGNMCKLGRKLTKTRTQ